jgi:hypothetical protein
MFEMILSLNSAQYPAAAWAVLFDCGRFDVVLLSNSFVLDSLCELNYRQEEEVFFPIVASSQPRIYRVSEALFPSVKRLGLETDHPHPSSGEFKKYWGCTCALVPCEGQLHLVSY